MCLQSDSVLCSVLTLSLVPVSLWSCFHSSVPLPCKCICQRGTWTYREAIYNWIFPSPQFTSPIPSALVILSQSNTCRTMVFLITSSRLTWTEQFLEMWHPRDRVLHWRWIAPWTEDPTFSWWFWFSFPGESPASSRSSRRGRIFQTCPSSWGLCTRWWWLGADF